MNSSDSNLPASTSNSGGTPFDEIRRQDETGEYWSARELMPILGYVRWENFTESIDQARAVIIAEQGPQAARAEIADFTKITKNVRGAARTLPDFRLSRHAAYLTAMRGDSRKPEIQAALTYFAIKTREAEILQMPTHAVALRGWAAELEAREAAEARAAELTAENGILAPKAGKWDEFMDADGLIGMTELADILKTSVRKLTEWLVTESIFRKQTSAQGGNRNLPRTVHVKGGHFEVKLETKNGFKFPVAYATSEGVDLIVDHWGHSAAA